MSRRGTSVASLAAASGIPPADLADRLSGAVAFDVDELEAVAAAIGEPIERLIAGR